MRALAPYIFGPILAIIIGLTAARVVSHTLDRAAQAFTLEAGRGK